MRIKFYGTRGSIPICGPEFQEFGGNTTCVLIDGPKRTGIFDAGTGIRELGKELVNDPNIGIDRPCFLVFSHFHWDHIQGLPFFAPAYDPSRHFVIAAIGRERYGQDIKSIFAAQMQSDYFPVPLDNMGAQIDFLKTKEDFLKDGKAMARAVKHNHPGNAYSYRIEGENGKVVVFCTDIEHGDEIDERIVDLSKGADLLIHEGQYTPEELPRFKGWGHSSWEQAVEVAQRACVKRLVITHHDPDHDDDFLREVEKKCQARFPNTLLAREKMEIKL
jgi:phosphoribosyl 1,2-cyclic phosphodiesterase